MENQTNNQIVRFFIDADACPVKDEVYRVGQRYQIKTFVVSNAFIQVPQSKLIERVIVEAGADIADDWIAERAKKGDIVITQDIPLAARVLQTGAIALGSNGKLFTTDSIGSALAGREIAEHLRSFGQTTSGPKPFDSKDRSRFLQELDASVIRARRTLLLQARSQTSQ
jgi:uncharacterized protein